MFGHTSNRSILVSNDVQSFDLFIYNLWRKDNLGSYLIKYSRLYSIFPKAMNNLISTNERFFIYLVGPSGSEKSHLIFDWFKIDTFRPGYKFQKSGPKISFWRSYWIWKSCMGYFFANSKIFRVHAVLHDSAGSVKCTRKKGTGYCYVAPSLPSSNFLGTWLE